MHSMKWQDHRLIRKEEWDWGLHLQCEEWMQFEEKKKGNFKVWDYGRFLFNCWVLVHQKASILACMGVALTLIY